MPDFFEITFSEPTHLPEELTGPRPGAGNPLHKASTGMTEITSALHALMTQSPNLQQAIASALTQQWNIDPRVCGIQRDGTQVSLLEMSAYLIASPVFSNRFADGWTTYGVKQGASAASLNGADWVRKINALNLGRSVAQVYSTYWAQRMPGHAQARLAHGEHLLQQHFTHSIELAYGLGQIDEHAWQQGLTASTWATIYWEHANSPRELAQATLLVQPQAEQDVWMLYRPGDTTVIRTFPDRATLDSELLAQRYTLWPGLPETPENDHQAERLVISPLHENAFSFALKQRALDHEHHALVLLEQACLEHEPGSLDWQSITNWEQGSDLRLVAPLADETTALIVNTLRHEQQLAEEQLHFDALNPALPLYWRTSRIAAQQAALERYLGNDASVTAPAMTTLRDLEEALKQLQEATSQRLEQLPDAPSAADWHDQFEGTRHVDFISRNLAQGLLAEARLQHALGDVNDAQLTLIETLATQADYSPEQAVEVASLALVVGAQRWPLHGFLSIRPSTDTEVQASNVMLYRSGQDGGLTVFADDTRLAEALLESLSGLWANTLIESVGPASVETLLAALADSEVPARLESTPLTTDGFDHCVHMLINAAQPVDATQTNAPPHYHRWLSAQLSIPRNEARAQALNAIAEQNRTEHIASQFTHSLNHLSTEERSDLRACVQRYRHAMNASITCLQQSLPERSQFIRHTLTQQLRTDLGLSAIPKITVNLPDHVEMRREPVVGSGQPHATKPVYYPSEARTDITLEHLLLKAIDEDLQQRLNFMRVTFDPPETTAHLSNALTSAYLLRLDKMLDLGGAYEHAIIEAFNGKEGDTAMAREWRDEVLREPFALSLELLALSKPTRLDDTGHALLRDAAAGAIEWTPLILNPGVAIDGSSKAVALSGVFLLHNRRHNTVVLYLPEAPNGRVVSQYPDPKSACQALEQMALNTTMLTWLATRPVAGDPERHRSYINQALLRSFSGFIAPGESQSLSLATHLSRLQMGRLITQHRQTARSQRELYLEDAAVLHNRVFDYIQLCLSFIPGAGVAVGLYDGWNASTAAVEAFMRGKHSQGVEHLNSVVLSIIDTLLDVAPGVGSLPGGRVASARAYTRLRQTQAQRVTLGKTASATAPDPFKGYEADTLVAAVELDSAGHLRNTFALNGKRYISRHGHHYEVQWDPTYNTWRLKGNALKHYKQPIRLSEDGVWETHGHLNGLLVEGGLQGAGPAFSRLYNDGWETMFGYIRRLRGNAIEQPMDELQRMYRETKQQKSLLAAALKHLNEVQGVGPDGPVGTPGTDAQIRSARQEAIRACKGLVEYHDGCLQALSRLKPTIGRRQYSGIWEEYLQNTARQNLTLIQLRTLELQALLSVNEHLTRDLTRLIDNLSDDLRQARIQLRRHRETILSNNRQLLEQLQGLEQDTRRNLELRNKLRGDLLTQHDLKTARIISLSLEPQAYRFARLHVMHSVLANFDHMHDIDFYLFFNQLTAQSRALARTLQSHFQLPQADLSRVRYGEALRSFKGQYLTFITHLDSWSIHFGNFVDATAVTSLRNDLTQLLAEIDKALPNYQLPTRGTGRPSEARVFETDDQQLLIGREERIEGERRMVVVNAMDNGTTESFRRIDGNRWQSTAPVIRRTIDPSRINELQNRAREQLADITVQKARWQGYMETDMAPASLQNMVEHYAINLRERARDLEDALGDRATSDQQQLMQRLRDAARNLDLHGRDLRIAKIKTTRQPNVGQLQFLHEQNAVEPQWGRILEPKKDSKGRPIEYLEEYEVIDRATDTVLWYAHFHFPQRPGSGFRKLSAGHLKIRHERNLLNAWHGPISEAEAMQFFGGLRPAAE
ncbi:hypothetical protein GCM10009504_03140 [Pseudomonas laurentiana]|uniref:hypothetical protein n=1 Tax=Pseudomonas laurentiana TaxID=2364649 RepID=UPI0016778B72|nr:hypothetical protein [Pseudomonas laurentiana]GGU49920.1 hypothetical protein GCM10009504_03140 [Pseudomonas laurentiana]